VYGSLVKVQSETAQHKLIPPEYDYILLIDTEGLLSIEKREEQYDKRLILFCLAVSHLVIVNVIGEINETLRQMLILCTQSLTYLGETRVTRPTVHFVLNQKTDPNRANCEEQVEIIRHGLIENGLEKLIDLGANNFHVLSTAFNRKPFSDPNVECAALSTDIKFVTDVQNLCKLFVDSSFEIIRVTGDRFSMPTEWVKFANSVLQVIKKYPDLTYFKDIFEREETNRIRQDIRQTFKEYLSPKTFQVLIEREKENSSTRIQDSFKMEQDKMLNILESNLKQKIERYGVSENVRERSYRFIQVQVTSRFRSWEVSAIMASERDKLNKMIHHTDAELQQLAYDVTGKICFMKKTSAIDKFEKMWEHRFAHVGAEFNSEMQWRQSIDLVCRLYDVLDQDALPSSDNVLAYLPFLIKLDTLEHTDFLNQSLSKISEEFISKASNINPLTPLSISTDYLVCRSDLERSYDFLDRVELKALLDDNSGKQLTRRKIISSFGQDFFRKINNNWAKVVRASNYFRVLIKRMSEFFQLKINDEHAAEIILLQEILGALNTLTQEINQELNIFNFSMSKSMQSLLHICAVLSIALFYYHRHKTHFNKVLMSLNKNKTKWQERFLRMVVIQENNDEKNAVDLVNEFDNLLYKLFVKQAKEIIEKDVENEESKLNKYSLMKQLDDEVYEAENDWLIRYVLDQNKMIEERFDKCWEKFKEKIQQQINIIMNSYSAIVIEFFGIIQAMKIALQEKGGNSLTFVDDLFEPSNSGIDSDLHEKKLCMATLIYRYFSGESIPTHIELRNHSIYAVQLQWQEIINTLPKLSDRLKDIFLSMKSSFETYNIAYIDLFLDKIIHKKSNSEVKLQKDMTNYVEKIFSSEKERLLIRIHGCQASCPCCKRLCDIDHHFDNATPVGQGENRHSCQSGHWIRGMGGIRYEKTNEASVTWCEIIKDENRIFTSTNGDQSWADFKKNHADWDFGNPRTPETKKAPYVHIWKKIGKDLCQRFGKMEFVEQNSPIPVNHFILLLDHSGSMNESDTLLAKISKLIVGNTTNTTIDPHQTNLSPWEHLLRAVGVFIRIRIQKGYLTDLMTIIIFANKAVRAYNRAKLNEIDMERLRIPMSICGGGTNFSAAFSMLIETLNEIKKDSTCNDFQQTIIFLTDGEPQVRPTSELISLSTDYKSMIARFWTQGLGNYNRKTLQEINTTMEGQLVDIEKPEDLVSAYVEIADFDDTT
ncbi:unnamed protein product, partial [Rotaria magnacalcarata]